MTVTCTVATTRHLAESAPSNHEVTWMAMNLLMPVSYCTLWIMSRPTVSGDFIPDDAVSPNWNLKYLDENVWLSRIWCFHSGGYEEYHLLGYDQLTCWFLLNYFFFPEDGGDMFLRNVDSNSTDYTALYPRRWYSSCVAKVHNRHKNLCKDMLHTLSCAPNGSQPSAILK
jgi:hypothetical protein